MADARTALRVIDELLWVLRRAGFAIATSQAIDAVSAIAAVGLFSRETVKRALATVLVKRARDQRLFDDTFDEFFARDPRRTLWERLAKQGFTKSELDTLREMLETLSTVSPEGALGSLLHRGADLDRLLQLATTSRLLGGMQSPLQAGFYTHRLLGELGAWRARDELASLAVVLADAMGGSRAEALVGALRREVQGATDDIRKFVQSTLAKREADAAQGDGAMGTPFSALEEAEVEEVRRSVRAFVQRLRGGARVRRRHAKKGRVDARATLRRAMRTCGVPFQVARKVRKKDKPRLVLLCDVSDSVRSVARFLLELAYTSQELFDRTRTFVFVSELGETTRLFEEHPIETALAKAYAGWVVPVTHNSNYGRMLRAFHETVLQDIDRRTTVVILGDGRTNYQDPAAEVIDAIRARARAVVWLCPEPRATWASGDSAMSRYAPKCTRVLEVRCARDLEDAARVFLALR